VKDERRENEVFLFFIVNETRRISEGNKDECEIDNMKNNLKRDKSSSFKI